MPAQPYSLGIGVQVDYQSIERAASAIERQLLNAFRGVSRDASKYAGQITESFGGKGGGGAPASDKLAGALGGAVGPAELPMLPGAIGPEAPKSIDKMATAIGDLAKETKPAVKELAKLDEEVREKPKDAKKAVAGFGDFAKAIGHVANVVSDFANKMRQGFAFTKDAELLEVATIRMAVGLGEGWKRADQLRDSIVDLGTATGQNVHEITKMDAALVNAGMTFTNFSTDTQKAIISLGHNYGLTGEQIATTATTLDTFGQDLGNVLGDAVRFQKGFKLPGVFEQLPGIVNFARDSFLSFSDKIVGSGADIVKTAMHTSGVFAKAFGTTMADATKRAEQAMSRFAESAQQDQDVFLGLGTEFSGLTMSLMQAGVPIQRAMDLTKEGFTDTVEAAKHYREVLDKMPNRFMKDRFMRQLQKELPRDVFALVKDTKLLQKTLADRGKAADIEKTWNQAGVGVFNDMTTTLQSATAELREMFNNVVEVGKAIGGQIGKMLGLDEMFKGATDTFKDFNKSILAFVKSERFTKWMETIKPYVVSIGKVLLPIGTLIGGIGGAIGSLWSGTKVVTKGFTLAEKPIAFLAKMFPRLGKGVNFLLTPLKVLGKFAGKLVSKAFGIGLLIDGFNAFKTAILDMGEVLGDPNATGMEKFEAIARGLIKGVGKFIDGALLGIPSWLLSKFFPDMEKSFDRGIAGIFDTLGEWFGDGPGGIFDTVGGWVSRLGDYLASHIPDLAAFTKSFGKALGQVLAFMAKTSVKGLKFIFIDLPIKIMKAEVGLIVSAVKSLFSKSADAGADAVKESFTLDKFLKTLGTRLSPITDFMVGLGEGIAGSFGTSLKAVGLRFKILWETVKYGAESAGDWIYDAFANNWDRMQNGMSKFGGLLKKFFTVSIPSTAEQAMVLVIGSWNSGFAAMKVVAYEMIAGVAKAFSDLATTAIDKLKSVADALPDMTPGIKDLRAKLDSAKATVGGLASSFTDMTTQAKADLANSLVGTAQKIKAIEDKATAEKAAIDEVTNAVSKQLAAEIAAREAVSAKNREAHREKLVQLNSEFAQETRNVEQQQQRATDARRFAKEARKFEEGTIEQFTKSGKAQKMWGAEGVDAASKVITDRTEKLVASLTEDVKKGSISVEEARKRLDDDRFRTLKAGEVAGQEAYKKTTGVAAGATAARAGGGPAPGGMSDEAVKQLMENINRGGGRGSNRVTVTLNGGDAVSRALVSKSQVDAKNAGTE